MHRIPIKSGSRNPYSLDVGWIERKVAQVNGRPISRNPYSLDVGWIVKRIWRRW